MHFCLLSTFLLLSGFLCLHTHTAKAMSHGCHWQLCLHILRENPSCSSWAIRAQWQLPGILLATFPPGIWKKTVVETLVSVSGTSRQWHWTMTTKHTHLGLLVTSSPILHSSESVFIFFIPRRMILPMWNSSHGNAMPCRVWFSYPQWQFVLPLLICSKHFWWFYMVHITPPGVCPIFP